MKKVVVILAAGKSQRFSPGKPKQFVSIGGIPTIVYSIRKFRKAIPNVKIVLVLRKEQISLWKKIALKYCKGLDIKVVKGGKTRMKSVKKALDALPDKERLIAIHDGSRPAVKKKLIQKVFDTAAEYGSAVPVVPETDSLVKIRFRKIKAVNRSNYFRVQTPQCYNLMLLKRAFESAPDSDLSDESNLWMQVYGEIKLVDGDRANQKLTFEEDLPAIKGIIREQ